MILPDFIPSIEFNWTTTAIIWVVAFLVAAIISNSGLGPHAKRAVSFLSIVGGMGITWAVLNDLGVLAEGQLIPEPSPLFFSLWGLGLLTLLPLSFILLGGLRSADYHPRWSPFAYLVKLVGFVASVLSIIGFYLQHLN